MRICSQHNRTLYTNHLLALEGARVRILPPHKLAGSYGSIIVAKARGRGRLVIKVLMDDGWEMPVVYQDTFEFV